MLLSTFSKKCEKIQFSWTLDIKFIREQMSEHFLCFALHITSFHASFCKPGNNINKDCFPCNLLQGKTKYDGKRFFNSLRNHVKFYMRGI